MLTELLAGIEALVRKAHGAEVIKPPQEPDHVYLLKTPDGGITRCEAEPKPRKHCALSLGTIINMARQYAEASLNPEIWYSQKGVTLILDDDTRRDQVFFLLERSEQLNALLSLKAEGYTQREFLHLLRVRLHGAVLPELIQAVRHLKFRTLTTGESMVGQGKASIGKSLEAELTGARELPEDLFLSIPVWANYQSDVRDVVRCLLEVDAQTERFYLRVLPCEIENAIAEAEGRLRNAICDGLLAQGSGDTSEKEVCATSAPAAGTVSVYHGVV